MIRKMLEEDIPFLLRIEQAVHLLPWSEQTFRVCFTEGYFGWVIEIDQKIAGFIIVAHAMDECHILNLCVDHAFQRQGLGQRLLKHAMLHALDEDMKLIWLEVRRSNTPAIQLYQKMKFQLVGERKKYYPSQSGEEDALIFAIQLGLR